LQTTITQRTLDVWDTTTNNQGLPPHQISRSLWRSGLNAIYIPEFLDWDWLLWDVSKAHRVKIGVGGLA
jgi:hypothetical protein